MSILRFPAELTAMVFLACLPDWDLAESKARSAPTLLLQICRQWRYIALNTQALWCNIPVFIPDDVRGKSPSVIVDAWASRALSQQISIRVSLGPQATPGQSEGGFGWFNEYTAPIEFANFVASLQILAPRIVRLEIELHITDIEAIGNALAATDFPALESLVVTHTGTTRYTHTHCAITPFKSAPKLSSVGIIRIPPSDISLPWHQIRSFTGELTSTGFALVFPKMSNLVSCNIEFDDSTSEGEAREMLAPLAPQHKLETLVLKESLDIDLVNIPDGRHTLAYLTLPGLKRLELLDCDDYEQETIDQFLQRSQPAKLHQLVIRPMLCQLTRISLSADSGLYACLQVLELWSPTRSCATVFFTISVESLVALKKLVLGCNEIAGEIIPKYGDDNAADMNMLLALAVVLINKREQGFRELTMLVDADAPSEFLDGQFLELEVDAVEKGCKPADELLAPFREWPAMGVDVYIGTKDLTMRFL